MKVTPLDLPGLVLVELKIFGDVRGFFVERFQLQRFAEQGLPTQFIQDNHSRSGPKVLRGLHYQSQPAQGKLVGVIRGCIWDVVVDIRPESPTFGKHFGLEMSDMNGRMLWIPPGFAHGFCVLGDEPADVLYKVDALPYHGALARVVFSGPMRTWRCRGRRGNRWFRRGTKSCRRSPSIGPIRCESW